MSMQTRDMRTTACLSLLVVQLLVLMTACAPATSPQAAPSPANSPANPTNAPAPATATPPPMPTPTLAIAAPKKPEQLQSISPEGLKELIEGGADVIVVDNQPAEAYAVGHIKGAVNFPWAAEIPSPKELPKNKLLILYCGCAHEEDSTDVAMQLVKRGYTKLMLLQGGWPKWVELDYPQETQ